MLDMPDFYKAIGDIAMKKTLQDIENNSIPDYSKVDSLREEKLNKENYMKVIKRFIKNCSINGNYENCKSELQSYTKKYINTQYPLAPETTFNILNNYKNNELLNILNLPLQSFILYVELVRQEYFYIQETYIRNSKDNQILLTHNFIQYSLELLNGICSLLLGSNNNSVISVYRTFYENYIVFSFLQKHQELTEAFLDHAEMDKCILSMEKAKLNNTQISTEVQKCYDELIAKHGADFKDSYGWTSAVIETKSKRNLKTIFDETDLDDRFRYFYLLSCKYTHSTAFSLLERPNFDKLIDFLYGITDIVQKEFDVLFFKLSINSIKEKELLKQWLVVVTNDFTNTINH